MHVGISCDSNQVAIVNYSKKSWTYNHAQNNVRPFDGWESFPFTASETKRDYL